MRALAWLAPIIVFGLVIFVHELGHFLAAKAMGVYAPRFSIGFGPALWRRRVGETEYVLAALPLGGYVRMASQDDEATAFLEGGSEEAAARQEARGRDWDPNAMKPFGPLPIPKHRWFESKPLGARLFILAAGVTMNVALAILLSIGVVAGYGRPYVPAVIDSVVPGNPAARAGIAVGDSIVAVDGVPIIRWMDVVEKISVSGGRDLTLEIMHGGVARTVHVTPESNEVKDRITGKVQRVGRIGARPKGTVARERLPFREAVVSGWSETWAMAGGIVYTVRGLITGGVPTSELGGPIAIARVSVEAARGGLEDLIYLIALLSINVAVLNLLPVPILDGGQILLNVLEAAKGGKFSERTREYILRAGLVAIALLVALVMYNDIRALFS